MTNPMDWVYASLVIDCRSCANYNNMRGRCHSTAKCVNANQYKSMPAIQLWGIKENEK